MPSVAAADSGVIPPQQPLPRNLIGLLNGQQVSARGQYPPGHQMGESYDVVLIGAGIVGLAVARALTDGRPGLTVAVVDKEADLAAHQSGHNSGVIHSGVYYRPGSDKARLAVSGHASMLRFCAESGIPVVQCGKYIAATTASERDGLAALAQRAEANGVETRLVTREELAENEPNVTGLAALHVPGTAIVDYRAVCHRLGQQLSERGVVISFGRECVELSDTGNHVTVGTTAGAMKASVVVNCGGLWSDRVARLHGTGRPDVVIVPFRGEYYDLTAERSDVVTSLVYPVPDPAYPFLGVHLTRSIHGGLHAGPNAILALARDGYTWRRVSARDTADLLTYPGIWRLAARHWRQGASELHRSLRRHAFGQALRRLVPSVKDDDLVPAPAGVRAQALTRSGTLVDDFAFRTSRRVIDVLNAPSPAATASLEIGRVVAARALTALAG